MEQATLRQLYQHQVHQDEAGLRAFETLLNCYCREVAGPAGRISIGTPFGRKDWPWALRSALQGGTVMQILLPRLDSRLLAVVKHDSLTGNYRYRPVAYYKITAQSWTRLGWRNLATLLLKDLALDYKQPFNDELLGQIQESVAVMRSFLDGAIGAVPDDPLAAFVHSEQSLRFGHPLHPAPKSRQGFTPEQVAAYSPEKGAAFALHYFSVRREFLLQRSLLDKPCDELVAAHGPVALEPDYALLPVHPWQAGFLLRQPLLQRALSDGALRDHGVSGKLYYPTSSVRTLYQPGNPYFYKCSLHVRLTNCVRKNAIYELDGALAVTAIMRRLLPALRLRFPNLRVMQEPAYQSVDLQSTHAAQNRLLTEGFGMILRQGIAPLLEPAVTPIMVGALFGNGECGRRWVGQLIQANARRQNLSAVAAVESWFGAYVQQLLPPVLYCFFEQGVIFEPHLQNVVVGFHEGTPARLYLRDFEGVKLLDNHLSAVHLAAESAKVRDALRYSEAKGWQRIAYCLFVNNFCEAITQLAEGDARVERRLWSVVAEQLSDYLHRYDNERSRPRIRALLDGEPFPAKANLINRFRKRADRDASYLPLYNPLRASRGEA